jgi:hypothetical protein
LTAAGKQRKKRNQSEHRLATDHFTQVHDRAPGESGSNMNTIGSFETLNRQ